MEDVEQRSVFLTRDLSSVFVNRKTERFGIARASALCQDDDLAASLVVLHTAMSFHNVVEGKDLANLDL